MGGLQPRFERVNGKQRHVDRGAGESTSDERDDEGCMSFGGDGRSSRGEATVVVVFVGGGRHGQGVCTVVVVVGVGFRFWHWSPVHVGIDLEGLGLIRFFLGFRSGGREIIQFSIHFMTMTPIYARMFRHCRYLATQPAHSHLVIASCNIQYQHVINFKTKNYSKSSISGAPAQRQRLRRSVHFVPADNPKFLTKALTLGADTIVFDLEDSVKDKHAGREILHRYLESIKSSSSSPHNSKNTEVLIRINPLSGSDDHSMMWRDDIEVGFMGGVDGFMIPKVESHEELRLLDELLTKLELERSETGCRGQNNNNGLILPKVLLPIATETPMAVLNIASIAKGPRVCAITWGCEDLSAELGSYGTRQPVGGGGGGDGEGGDYLDIFRYCRSMCLLAAKAANVQAIDGIYQNVRDISGLVKETSDAKYMGFDGKLTLHPDQISAVHSAFEPTPVEFEEASQIVSLWEQGSDDVFNKMKGSLEYNGKMIDLPHVVRAKKVISRRSTLDKSPVQHETTSGASIGGINSSDYKTIVTAPQEIGHDVAGDVFPRMNHGRYFEDLHPGTTIQHFLTRTVTEADNVFFTCLTLNSAPIHLDHELSKGNAASLSSDPSKKSDGIGKPLFNSMFTLGLLVGMSVPELTHGTTVANLGFSEVIFPKPVYPGDTLRAETTILEKRESKSRPTQGIVTFQHRAYNQRGEMVCKATRQALMKKRT